MTAYYNEHDPYAAQWLRNLITAGHLAKGEVDERSIVDINPGDLARDGNGTPRRSQPIGSTASAGFWEDADWLPCRDGKARPVEPGTFPLAHGVSNRVGRLRAYGNAIVPQVAAEFIAAYLECQP